ncbi:MAG: nucleotidyltransferase family protein [Verrucomicrobiota bacterium]
MNHTTLSRKGGRARSAAKTVANRAKAAAYWEAVRAGARPPPRRPKCPPARDLIAKKLAAYCRRHGITRLEVFGSVARGESRRGSDVDLLATFETNPGSRFFTMEADMTELLGVPVHLLTRDAVEQMTNPFRRESILADAKEIYRA